MHPRPDLTVDDRGESIRELIGRTIDSGKAYVQAEVALAKQTASTWTSRAVPAIGFVVAAIMIVQAALTVLLAALGIGLAMLIGPVGGFVVAAVVGFAVAGLLGWLALNRFKGINQ